MFEWIQNAIATVRQMVGGGNGPVAPCPLPTATIVVTVVRGDNGAAVAGVGVSISGTAGASAPSGDGTGMATFTALAAGAYQVAVSLAGSPAEGFRIEPFEPNVQLAAGGVANVAVQVFPRYLDLVTIDEHFAPSVETCDITYNIYGLSADTVLLRILDWQNRPIFERELTPGEKADGDGKALAWDGKLTHGPDKDKWATPLMSPFKAQLLHSSEFSDEEPFRVLYHSIKVDWGLHTPDGQPPPESERTKFIQYRLNELGYDPGPVDGADGPMTQAAVRRFQRANYEVGTQTLLAVDGVVGSRTFAALKDGGARERARWEAGSTPLTADAKLYVEDNFFSDRGENFVTTTLPQFSSMDRKRHVEDQLGRPFVPIEAEILLLGKADDAVSAPAAVGPAQVAWEVDDSAEDLSAVTGATANTYVDRARQFGTVAATAVAARIDGNGDNLMATLDGYRPTTAAAYAPVWFPQGAKLAPFAVDRYVTQTRGTDTFHQAIVKAWVKGDQHAERQGRAGLYVRFSNKGGDDGKVRVSLSFEGHGNQARLETDHQPRLADLTWECGRWTVWRLMRVSAYCKQATPTRVPADVNWTWFKDRWKEAFIEVENGGSPLATLDYATVVPEDAYKAAVLALPPGRRPPGVTNAASLTYRANAIYGGPPVRAQAVGEQPQQYVNNVVGAGVTPWIQHPLNAILGLIHAEVRKTSPEGLIIFDFAIYDQQIEARRVDATTGALTTVHSRTWPSTAGYVRVDGAVTMNVHNPFDVSCYSLHESGHGRFLFHHITNGTGPSDNPTHHDADQSRCAMSYAIGADTPQQWTYGFCGKCLLRLRGAKITALPNQYTG